MEKAKVGFSFYILTTDGLIPDRSRSRQRYAAMISNCWVLDLITCRENSPMSLQSVFISPPSADAESACEVIHSITAGLQTQHTDAFVLISGDFNHVSLDSTLLVFHQYVNCPARKNKTIDLLYACPPSHRPHLFPLVTAAQVTRELRTINTRKAAGPDKVCPRLLRVPLSWGNPSSTSST